jgi:hypothetical protein
LQPHLLLTEPGGRRSYAEARLEASGPLKLLQLFDELQRPGPGRRLVLQTRYHKLAERAADHIGPGERRVGYLLPIAILKLW